MPLGTTYEDQIGFRKATRTAAADADVSLEDSDGIVFISSGGGSAGTLSSNLSEGGSCKVVMTAFDTNPYTIAVVGGTLTFNAAGESADVSSDGTSLYVTGLGTATVV